MTTLSSIPDIEARFAKGSTRPPIWYKIAERLLADGFAYAIDSNEWVNGTTGERGRLAWNHTDTEAWLIHPHESRDNRYHVTTLED